MSDGDDTILNQGAGGDRIRTIAKLFSGIVKKTQAVVLDIGGTGSESLLSTSNPLPTQLYGATDSGEIKAVPVDGQGHVEVAIHSPRLPFGAPYGAGRKGRGGGGGGAVAVDDTFEQKMDEYQRRMRNQNVVIRVAKEFLKVVDHEQSD